MKALRLGAEWDPRTDYSPLPAELENRKAIDCSKIWRYPRLDLIDTEVPPLEPNQVLVKVNACGVCGSDVHLVETDAEGYTLFSGSAKLPTILGHEFAGQVVDIGAGVTDIAVGDLVAAESVLWCGTCLSCRGGRVNQCQNMRMVGFSAAGAFADFISIPAKHCWKLTSLESICHGIREVCELGALIEPIGCAYNGLFVDGGGFLPGQSVAIYGAGPIGLGAVMLARLAGASQVIAFDIQDARCDLARRLGADIALNPLSIDIPTSEALAELTHGRGVDIQVEAAGAASQTIPEALLSFADNGRLIYLGRQDSSASLDFNPMVSRANHIIGARGHAGHGVFHQVIRLMASGRLRPAEMITSRFDFHDVTSAIQRASLKGDGKVMVNIGETGGSGTSRQGSKSGSRLPPV